MILPRQGRREKQQTQELQDPPAHEIFTAQFSDPHVPALQHAWNQTSFCRAWVRWDLTHPTMRSPSPTSPCQEVQKSLLLQKQDAIFHPNMLCNDPSMASLNGLGSDLGSQERKTAQALKLHLSPNHSWAQGPAHNWGSHSSPAKPAATAMAPTAGGAKT